MLYESYSVSQLNELIREVITGGFPRQVWICGEIQGYDRNRDKKHVFFELCEKNPVSHEIIARTGLVIFSGRKLFIEEKLKEAQNAFTLKDDIEVKFLCQVDFYPPHGAVRLVVETIDPVYTLGKIAQDRQKLIVELKAKGLLDKNKALPLSEIPLNIGLITAFDSAAYNDFVSEIKRSRFAFKIFFMNTVMQGKKTPETVCAALDVFSRMKSLDAVVITRGGGSIADLSCFDNRLIAEKIAQLNIPVLSGIGHEINVTITDLAAYTYEKTPTAAAHFLVQRVADFLLSLNAKSDELFHLVWDKIDAQKDHLRDLAINLENHTRDFMKDHHERILSMSEQIRRRPLYSLQEEQKSMLRRQSDLIKAFQTRLERAQTAIRNYDKMVEIASPLKTLRRGFSITRTAEGKIIKSIEAARQEEEILTQLTDGTLKSRVQSKSRDNGG